MSFHLPLLLEPQRNQIFEAIERAGLDRGEFRLTERGDAARLEHRPSASRFVLVRDPTWRFVGYYSISEGPEIQFDRSWGALVTLLGVWLAEVTWHIDTSRGVR